MGCKGTEGGFSRRYQKEGESMADKILRTHMYCQAPKVYGIQCPKDKAHKLHWSEFEGHIWCYDCKEDINQDEHIEATGIFSGPIPVNTTALMGISFDRLNVKTGGLVKFALRGAKGDKEYDATWSNRKS